MGEWLRGIWLPGAVAVLSSFLVPEKNEKLRRAVLLGISLFFLCALIRPFSDGALSDLLRGLSPPSAGGAVWQPSEETLGAMEDSAAEGVAADVASHFALPRDCVRATLSLALEGEECRITALTLTLSGVARTADLYAVREYAAATYAAPCEVICDGG